MTSVRTYLLHLLAIVSLVLHTTSAWAITPFLDVGQNQNASISLTRYLGTLQDSSASRSIEEIEKAAKNNEFTYRDSDTSDLRFGYTRSPVWLRLELSNSSESVVKNVLELGYAPLTQVELFRSSDGHVVEHQLAGSARPFFQRSLLHRYPAFEVSLAAHTQVVYFLRVEAISALIVPARLWSSSAFSTYQRNDYFTQAAYYGMASAMVLFNLLLFAALRDRIYLLYVCFVGTFALGLATQGGLAQEFLWPNTTRWSAIANYIIFSLAFASMLAFMREMLELRRISRRMDATLKWTGLGFLCTPLVFWPAMEWLARPMIWAYMAGVILVLWSGIVCARQGQRSGYLFLLAFLPTAFGSLITVLRGLSLVPTNGVTVNGMQFGSALEMILLAFALADRFNRLRSEMAVAQADTLKAKSETVRVQTQALTAQAHLIGQLQESERTLEQRVNDRTEQLEASNQKLQILSNTDGLTGVSNRRHFDLTLQSEFNRARRSMEPLTIALIDIDWFKKYNDHYGHQMGDDCLKQVTLAIAGCVGRAGDTVARYGGEEFVFIASNTDDAAAETIAWKLCEAVRRLQLPHEASPLGHVSISIGVATCVPTEGLLPAQLLSAADKALYRAKGQGRNRVAMKAAGQLLV
jgi:diguanylate cyclase (GGDEF)-like protein